MSTTLPAQPNIDALILAEASDDWRKVARIIGRVGLAINGSIDHATHEIIAERIGALVASGQLEAQGDISRWRYSEVRLVGETS